MKIHEILTEAEIVNYPKETLTGSITDILNKDCSEALRTMKLSPLWRGSKGNKDEIIMLDPSKGIRKSENTTNYYTVLMDSSPYMQGWPKRANSLICATTSQIADTYGVPYAIFPYNGTKIAVCPDMDLWETQLNLSEVGGHNVDTWDSINYRMSDLGFTDPKNINDLEDDVRNGHVAALVKKEGINIPAEKIISYFQQQMAPEKVGFELTTVKKWNPSASGYTEREVWFSAPCVAIRGDIYTDWLNS